MENTDTTNKKGFLKTDTMFVCGMLVFYGLCTIGVIAALFWGLDRRSKTISAQATTTANAIVTQQANVTATAIAHATELSQYKIIDKFDTNGNSWRVGFDQTSYWQGKIQVLSGVYSWDVDEATTEFNTWAFAPVGYQTGNYDTYVDIKFKESPSKACGGFLFHVAREGWSASGYVFYICSSGYYAIYFHKAADWEDLGSNYSSAISPTDWNRLEVLVRDSHFTFLVNGQVILKADHNGRNEGKLALYIDVDEDGDGTKIVFDNFGFQDR